MQKTPVAAQDMIKARAGALSLGGSRSWFLDDMCELQLPESHTKKRLAIAMAVFAALKEAIKNMGSKIKKVVDPELDARHAKKPAAGQATVFLAPPRSEKLSPHKSGIDELKALQKILKGLLGQLAGLQETFQKTSQIAQQTLANSLSDQVVAGFRAQNQPLDNADSLAVRGAVHQHIGAIIGENSHMAEGLFSVHRDAGGRIVVLHGDEKPRAGAGADYNWDILPNGKGAVAFNQGKLDQHAHAMCQKLRAETCRCLPTRTKAMPEEILEKIFTGQLLKELFASHIMEQLKLACTHLVEAAVIEDRIRRADTKRQAINQGLGHSTEPALDSLFPMRRDETQNNKNAPVGGYDYNRFNPFNLVPRPPMGVL